MNLNSLFSEIGDADDDKTDDGEHSANVRYPCEGTIVWFRRWWDRVDVLQRMKGGLMLALREGEGKKRSYTCM